MKTNKYLLYIVFTLSVIGLVLVHGFLAISPYRSFNENNSFDVYNTALNNGLVIPLILIYVVLIGSVVSIILNIIKGHTDE